MFFGIRDGKKSGSGINIPDPQHWRKPSFWMTAARFKGLNLRYWGNTSGMTPSGYLGQLRRLSAIVGRWRCLSRLLPGTVALAQLIQLLELSYGACHFEFARCIVPAISNPHYKEVTPHFHLCTGFHHIQYPRRLSCSYSSLCCHSKPAISLYSSLPVRILNTCSISVWCLPSSCDVSTSSANFSSKLIPHSPDTMPNIFLCTVSDIKKNAMAK